MSFPKQRTPLFAATREAGWALLALAATAQSVSSVVINAAFQGSIRAFLFDLRAATGGLIGPTLVANLVPLAFVIGLVLFAVGRFAPADVGWVPAKLLPALLLTLGFWLVAQLILAVLLLLGGGSLSFHPAWTHPGTGFVLGGVLGQLFGNALTEETVFRGFFFPQLFKKFGKKLSPAWALVAAALVSQILFALHHIPNRLFVKSYEASQLLPDQLRLVFLGLIFVAIYGVTQNLWLAVGIHALANDPAPLVQVADGVVAAVWFALALALVLLWNPLQGLIGRKRPEPARRTQIEAGGPD